VNADVFFTGTKAHKVCADYGRVSRILGKTYAIVSDGCSSSPDTDVGARLLTLAAANTLPNVIGSHWPQIAKQGDSGEVQRVPLLPQDILEKAHRAVFTPPWTPLLPTCLDATLLVAYETPTGVVVEVAGDGVVIGRKRDKTCLVYDFDCDGAPSYLSYLLNRERMNAYLQQFGKRTITVRRLEFNPLTSALVSKHTESPFTGETDYPGEAKPFYRFFFATETYDLVLLLTDGVKSFQKPTFQSVPMEDVLGRLLDFKSFTGEFVTRRVQAFLKRECSEWQHNDDLGVAGIYLGEL